MPKPIPLPLLKPPSPQICFLIPSLFTAQECSLFLKPHLHKFQKAIDNYPTYYRNNQRLVVDSQELALRVFGRVREFLPDVLRVKGGGEVQEEEQWRLKGINQRIRFCRYGPHQYFNRHLDGTHHRTSTLHSKLTFMIYLNSQSQNFQGGRTLFYSDRNSKEILASYVPSVGDTIIFDHWIWHQGEILGDGEKFVMRSDVMYERVGVREGEQGKGKSSNEGQKKDEGGFKGGHSGYIWSLLLWDQHTLLSGGRDKKINLWSSQTGKLLQSLPAHSSSVLSLTKLTPQLLLSCSRDKHIALWSYNPSPLPSSPSIQTQAQQASYLRLQGKWIGHQGSTVLCLLPIDEHTFVSGGADGLVKLWSIQYGKQGKEIGRFVGHSNWVWKIVKISNEIIASCSQDKTIILWHIPSQTQLQKIPNPNPLLTLTYNPTHSHLYTGDLQGNITCYSFHGEGNSYQYQYEKLWEFKAHEGLIRKILVLKGDGVVASCGEDFWVRVWDFRERERGMGKGVDRKLVYSYQHGNFAQDLSYNEKKKELISCSYDGRIVVHELGNKIGSIL